MKDFIKILGDWESGDRQHFKIIKSSQSPFPDAILHVLIDRRDTCPMG